MPTNQGQGSQANSSSLGYQKPPFQGAYNAPRGPLSPQPHVAQSYPYLGCNEMDKVNKKVDDIERMIGELKELNKRMMKTLSKQFA